jgi:hypothetical protein
MTSVDSRSLLRLMFNQDPHVVRQWRQKPGARCRLLIGVRATEERRERRIEVVGTASVGVSLTWPAISLVATAEFDGFCQLAHDEPSTNRPVLPLARGQSHLHIDRRRLLGVFEREKLRGERRRIAGARWGPSGINIAGRVAARCLTAPPWAVLAADMSRPFGQRADRGGPDATVRVI